MTSLPRPTGRCILEAELAYTKPCDANGYRDAIAVQRAPEFEASRVRQRRVPFDCERQSPAVNPATENIAKAAEVSSSWRKIVPWHYLVSQAVKRGGSGCSHRTTEGVAKVCHDICSCLDARGSPACPVSKSRSVPSLTQRSHAEGTFRIKPRRLGPLRILSSGARARSYMQRP